MLGHTKSGQQCSQTAGLDEEGVKRASQAEGAGPELMMPHLEPPPRLQGLCDGRERA